MPNTTEPKGMQEQMDDMKEDIIKININVSAVDRELFYNTLTISKAMTEKINEYFKQFDACRVEISELKDAVLEVGEYAKSMTNGGLTSALQNVLPEVFRTMTNKEIEKNKSEVTLYIAIVGSLGTLLGLALPHIFQYLSR